MASVAEDIFAHYYITGRNALAIRLIVSSWSPQTVHLELNPSPPHTHTQEALQSQEAYNVSDDLKQTLSKLASLNNHKNSKVALSARQVSLYYTVIYCNIL